MGMLETVGDVTLVDTDRRPFVPTGLGLLSHKSYGKIPFDLDQITFWSPAESLGEHITGVGVLSALEGKAIANANFLDVFLYSPKTIPHFLKDKEVCFLGTEYELHKRSYIRIMLYTKLLGWSWRHEPLSFLWEPNYVVPIHNL